MNIIIGNTIHTNSKGASGKYAAVVAYYTVQTTFTNNQIFSWNENQYLTKTCLEVGRESSEWIIKDNIMRSSKEKPALVYDENAAHIVKDNIIK